MKGSALKSIGSFNIKAYKLPMQILRRDARKSYWKNTLRGYVLLKEPSHPSFEGKRFTRPGSRYDPQPRCW